MPTLWLAVVLAAVIGLHVGVVGSLDNSLVQTAADPAYLGRVTSAVMFTMVGLAPLSYPLVGAAIGAWGAAPRASAAAFSSGRGDGRDLRRGAARRTGPAVTRDHVGTRAPAQGSQVPPQRTYAVLRRNALVVTDCRGMGHRSAQRDGPVCHEETRR